MDENNKFFKNSSDDSDNESFDDIAESLFQFSLTQNDNNNQRSRSDSSWLESSTISTSLSSSLRVQSPRNDNFDEKLAQIPFLSRKAQIKNYLRSHGDFLGPTPPSTWPESRPISTRVSDSERQRWQMITMTMNHDTTLGQTMPCFPRQTETPLSSVLNHYNSLPSSSNSVQGGFWSHASSSRNPTNCIGSSKFRGQDYYDSGNGCLSNNNMESCFQDRQYSHALLENVQGRIAYLARDQACCRFLIDRLSLGDPYEIDLIFAEALRQLDFLAVHSAGSCLVQKLIDVVDEHKLQDIVSLVTNDNDYKMLKNICSDDYGMRVMMSLIERLKGYEDKQSLLMRALSRIVVYVTTNTNSSQVLGYCFSSFSYQALKPLVDKIAQSFLDIAINKNGSCLMQKCLRLCCEHNDNKVFNAIVTSVLTHLHSLSDDPYGNYVVQLVIEMKDPNINGQMTEKLKGHFGTLSINKASSNMTEKLIQNSERDTAEKIIVEISESRNLLKILQDQYGNYVAKTALKESKRQELPVYKRLYDFIQANSDHLVAHQYGKNVMWQLKNTTTR